MLSILKSNFKRLFNHFCNDKNVNYVRLLFHNEIRWYGTTKILANGNEKKFGFIAILALYQIHTSDKKYRITDAAILVIVNFLSGFINMHFLNNKLYRVRTIFEFQCHYFE